MMTENQTCHNYRTDPFTSMQDQADINKFDDVVGYRPGHGPHPSAHGAEGLVHMADVSTLPLTDMP